jgi:demethylmenaquinone methyltransferase/2-methoxy-6-polyprenyl-1,4-benzoquinol methylase
MTTAMKVSFGYRRVTPEEKKKLVHEQFNPIASTYDLADAILSGGLDSRWRKKGIRLLGLMNGDNVLDVCGGTADFALLAGQCVGESGQVIVYDFNEAMIAAGIIKIERSPHKRTISSVQGDAEDIAFGDATFDAITVGFGVRNFARLEQGLKEMYRVLKTGGKLLVLEFSLPAQKWQKSLYDFYSFRIMPLVARVICGTDGPFRYLAESIRVFPPPEQVAELLRSAGFSDVVFSRLTAGLAVLYLAKKA